MDTSSQLYVNKIIAWNLKGLWIFILSKLPEYIYDLIYIDIYS